VDPDIRDDTGRLYVSWLVAPTSAFLRYLSTLCAAFETLHARPLTLQSVATFPPLSRIIWMQEQFSDTEPVLDQEVQLLQETCLPRDLGVLTPNLVRECARRVLWAGGYAFASDEANMDKAMQHLMVT